MDFLISATIFLAVKGFALFLLEQWHVTSAFYYNRKRSSIRFREDCFRLLAVLEDLIDYQES